jgi:asparagine synthase (glutamine-hydrolysing)
MRYLALIWHSADPVQVASARALRARLVEQLDDWLLAVDTQQLVVLVHQVSAASIYSLQGNYGVVLGTLFEGSYGGGEKPRPVVFDETRAASIYGSEGRDLILNYWGAYIAFVYLPDCCKTLVIRDPSGSVPCFYSSVDGIQIIFARLSDFERIHSQDLGINWDYIHRYLVYGPLPSIETGIKNVQELLPGECLTYCGCRVTKALYWDPLALSKNDQTADIGSARELLHIAVRSSVHAWASCHDTILLELSGGVDSSIVLACLADAPGNPRVVALNFYSDGADSDERKFARLAAAHAKVELMELRRDPAISWGPLLYMRRAPGPKAVIGTLQTHQQIRDLASSTAARIRFSGTGGDILFYRHFAWMAAADYVWEHGPFAKQIYRHAMSAAHLDRTSIWRLLRYLVLYGVLHRDHEILADITKARSLLNPAIVDRVTSEPHHLHGLYRGALRVPAGKLYQLRSLAPALSPAINPFDSIDALELAPLLSQPVLEACARIPLYDLMYDGRDRALARDAFANQLPQQILCRQSKGGLEEYASDNLRHNIRIVRELVLDGYLAAENILDKRAIEQLLAGEPTRNKGRVTQLSEYVNTEAWLRSWLDKPRRDAL